MKNVLFVGRYYSPKILDLIGKSSKGNPGYSTHNYEMAAINGLSSFNDVDVRSITSPSIFSFPHNNNRFFTPSDVFRIENVECRSIGFCNLVLLNKIWSFIATTMAILREVRKFEGKEVNVICNLASSARAVKWAQKLSSKTIRTTFMLLDIPQMVSNMNKMNPIKHYLVKRMNRGKMEIASNSDHLILMTEQMMDFISKPIDHVVIEGWIDPKLTHFENKEVSNKRVILYAGTLRRVFGIMNLVEAFSYIKDSDVELWICGSGDAEEDIRKCALKDSRIKLLGLLPAEKARCIQQTATILVNPRTSEGDYTRYSFPSKTLEYLLSGRPAIVYRLPGMPDEYLNYLYVPEEETVEGLAKKIQDVLSFDSKEREARAMAGRDFVIKYKTPEAQMQKVYNMLFK